MPRIYARRLSDAVGTVLPGSEGALGPVFSPDDKWLLFTSPGNVWKKLPVQGGTAVDITIPAGVTVGLMRWNRDDGFAVTLGSGAVGPASRLRHHHHSCRTRHLHAHEQSLDVMEVLPDGNLLVIGTDVYPAGHAFIIDRATGKRTPLLDATLSWIAAANGYLVWTDPVGVMYAAPFDGKRVTGAAHGFGATAQTTRGTRPRIAIAHSGSALVFVPAQQASLARVGRDGRVQTLLNAPRAYHNPRVSPDGRQVLLDIAGTERDVWLLDFADTTLNRITFETTGHDAVWTPDGRRVVFAVSHGGQIGIHARAADGGGTTDSILTEGPQLSVHTVTPDGRTGIAVRVTSVAVNGFDLMSVPLTGADRHATPLLDSRYMEGFPALSTDGQVACLCRRRIRSPGSLRAGLSGNGWEGRRVAERGDRAGLVSQWARALLHRTRQRRAAAHRGTGGNVAAVPRRLPHATLRLLGFRDGDAAPQLRRHARRPELHRGASRPGVRVHIPAELAGPLEGPDGQHAMTAPSRLAVALADRYRIEREIGAGGMATVYLAEDLKHHRQVAIKVLRPELGAVIGAERFLAEIRTTANLQHPHILGLIDSGEVEGLLYYVMPFIEGESLRDRLSREKQLPIDDAVRIATEVASALDYAHRHGVIHRDIKPENILLHDGRALVADFGIALAASKAGSRMTETGMSLGTPHYMSPEQAMGEREITARSDVYALGCVTYEMLTGDPPFTGSTAQAIVARVVTESPRLMVPQRHTIPPQVEAAVLTALEKLPADRFATAKDFADALVGTGKGARYAATVADISDPPSPPSPPSPPGGRSPPTRCRRGTRRLVLQWRRAAPASQPPCSTSPSATACRRA